MHGARITPAAETSLLQRYHDVRAFTERLCESLETEDFVPQPVPDVSPAKWNIAHTTWFFEEMILKAFSPGYRVYDERFGFLFNSYYNSIGSRTRRDHRGSMSRPTVKEVFAFRHHVDEAVGRLIAGGLPPNAEELIVLGLQHEQQHQELLVTDVKYTFSLNPLYPAFSPGNALEESCESGSGSFIELDEGIYEIGFEGTGFHFDNERERHRVFLDRFSISDKLVTNGEFLEFINAGGYRDFRFWHSEGWDWVVQNAIEAPLYWDGTGSDRQHFTLGGMRELPLDAPVCHISFYEASAFAEWSGMRLPTEAEWEAANAKFGWGKRWEWTGSAYLPYPGFRKPDGAVGEYNGKFMINQMVLRGASVVTPAGHSRPTYRNFFHPHLRWQFTGLRLARPVGKQI